MYRWINGIALLPTKLDNAIMYVSSLRIRNLKSYPDATLDPLAKINIIVGRNNSGKSVLLRALQLMQEGHSFSARDIRFGEDQVGVTANLLEIEGRRHWPDVHASIGSQGRIEVELFRAGATYSAPQPALYWDSGSANVPLIPPTEPANLIYPFLAKRKVTGFDESVDQGKTRAVVQDLRYLVSKVQRLSNIDHPSAEEYGELCRKVLGFRVSSHASPGGQQAGIPVGKIDYIPIESMGDGVPHLLGLITDLCVAEGNVFLIEELENDIHPEGLKALLDVILEKSASNQFFITTHSNIVLRWLGASPEAKIFRTSLDFTMGEIPTTTVGEVANTPEARTEILSELGYELRDFDLWSGWLFLEESSAERIIRDQLIPLFVPRLSQVRLVAVGGTSKAEPTFEDFNRMFRFTHLETTYQNRAWVQLDGDDTGKAAVEQLRERYSQVWDPEQFGTWAATNFESYYPAEFAERAVAALALKGDAKRNAKKALLDELLEWCEKNDEDTRRSAFEASAGEVIEFLRGIDDKLFG